MERSFMKSLPMILLALWLSTGVAHARTRIVRIGGTVNSIGEVRIGIAKTDGKLRSVILSDSTTYLRNDLPVTSRYIKVGDDVVVRATKDHHQLVAAEVMVGLLKTVHCHKSCQR